EPRHARGNEQPVFQLETHSAWVSPACAWCCTTVGVDGFCRLVTIAITFELLGPIVVCGNTCDDWRDKLHNPRPCAGRFRDLRCCWLREAASHPWATDHHRPMPLPSAPSLI